MKACIVILSLLLSIFLVSPAQANVCTGDCNIDSTVTVNELVTLVNIASGVQTIDDCFSLADDVTIDYLVRAVGSALSGCPLVVPENKLTITLADDSPQAYVEGGSSNIVLATWVVDPHEVLSELRAVDVRILGVRPARLINGTAELRIMGGDTIASFPLDDALFDAESPPGSNLRELNAYYFIYPNEPFELQLVVNTNTEADMGTLQAAISSLVYREHPCQVDTAAALHNFVLGHVLAILWEVSSP